MTLREQINAAQLDDAVPANVVGEYAYELLADDFSPAEIIEAMGVLKLWAEKVKQAAQGAVNDQDTKEAEEELNFDG